MEKRKNLQRGSVFKGVVRITSDYKAQGIRVTRFRNREDLKNRTGNRLAVTGRYNAPQNETTNIVLKTVGEIYTTKQTRHAGRFVQTRGGAPSVRPSS